MTTKIPVELSSTPSIVDNGDATAITIDSNEVVSISNSITFTPNAFTFADNKIGTYSNNFMYIYGGSAGLIMGDNSSGSNRLVIRDSNTMEFEVNSSERMRITSSGHVLIGTTSASNFPANERAITLLGSSMTISHNTANGSGDSYVRFGRDTNVIGSITQFGNNAVSYNTSSDYRLKENVNYEFDALSRVSQLKPARFNFIADADTTVDGFIAHEVSDIVPEAITGEKDGEEMQGIDHSKLVPLLTKAIQEQQTQIEELRQKIETLKN